jgi:hypothetical protein
MLCLTIESGIPVPARGDRTGLMTALAEQLRALEIGQSVLVPGFDRVDHAIRIAKRGTEKYFESRRMTTGIRIWRLE